MCGTGVALFGGVPKGPHRGPREGPQYDQSEGLQIRRIGVPDGLGGTEVHIQDMDHQSHYISNSTTRRVYQGCPPGMPIRSSYAAVLQSDVGLRGVSR